MNPAQGLVRLFLGDLLLVHELGERPADPFHTSFDVFLLDVPQTDVVAVQGRQLRDAVAHLPRADDREFHRRSRPKDGWRGVKGVVQKPSCPNGPIIHPWLDSPVRSSFSGRLPWRSSCRSSSSRRTSNDAGTIRGAVSCARSRGRLFWPSSWFPRRSAAFSSRWPTPPTRTNSSWRCSSRSCTTTTASSRKRSRG